MLTRHSTQMPQYGSRVIWKDSEVPSMSEEKKKESHLFIFSEIREFQQKNWQIILSKFIRHSKGGAYFANGSDFPVGNPLPCVLVSTFPQCTATWQSLCSTILQYSCCAEEKKKEKGWVEECMKQVSVMLVNCVNAASWYLWEHVFSHTLITCTFN